jgi:hypothetical protein
MSIPCSLKNRLLYVGSAGEGSRGGSSLSVLRLLRVGWKAKSQEHATYRKANGFFTHCFSFSLLSAHMLMSLDHLVCPRQHIRWNREADLLCRFQIDDKLEFLRQLDG